MKHKLTEVNLNIDHAAEAVEHYFNAVLFKQQVRVESVVWYPKGQCFKVALKEGQSGSGTE